jgi:hypothetical protein
MSANGQIGGATLFGYSAYYHPEHGALIQRVLRGPDHQVVHTPTGCPIATCVSCNFGGGDLTNRISPNRGDQLYAHRRPPTTTNAAGSVLATPTGCGHHQDGGTARVIVTQQRRTGSLQRTSTRLRHSICLRNEGLRYTKTASTWQNLGAVKQPVSAPMSRSRVFAQFRGEDPIGYGRVRPGTRTPTPSEPRPLRSDLRR